METYDLQQAYDVADMLKQYFRELPDTLLTAKMSDTFIAIFQRKSDFPLTFDLAAESHRGDNEHFINSFYSFE